MTKALIVATNTPKFDNVNRATGLWLREATHFQQVMQDNEIEVAYASPKGGYIPLDPLCLSGDNMDQIDWTFYLNDEFRNHSLAASIAPDKINPEDYQVIYFAGGHGAMWDFPENKALAKIAEQVMGAGGIVSANCVGATVLLAMRTATGKRFTTGKKLTSFTNDEEALNGLTSEVKFLPEDELKKAGADFVKGDPFQPNVVVDGNLITGQNPNSATAVGEAVIKDLLK
ncbi:type 1 glutamine amidotransferase domain-containing protein [Lentilactobacillus raoultii]|uniref:Type 1 glutamine amidotransferase domain-containing protein n=1 Tax=Lentilactobacillus raoultii TaxID=1987503 RepID=A0ABW3PFR6_9LACO|nr:type 1 glutamine amidotransferase domain-containing protein [Lentilactobacillus raoultii]